MAAKLQTSRKRGEKDLEGELETLQAPAAPQIQDGQQLQMPQPPQQTANLAKHEIRDRIAMGGMSQLELQSLVRSNHFLNDEDIAAYTGKGGGHQISAPQTMSPPPDNVFAAHGGPTPHAAPIGGHEALGFDGSLAPQGLMAPQGVMTKVGMLGFVKGLMGIRSDGAKPGWGNPQQQKNPAPTQRSSQSSPQPQRPAAQQASKPNSQTGPQQQQPAAAQRPAAAQQQAPAQSQGQSSSAFQPVSSAFDSSQSFQPVQQGGSSWFSSAMWGSNRSPFAELLNRFFALLKSLFSSQGGGGRPPHLRGGKH